MSLSSRRLAGKVQPGRILGIDPGSVVTGWGVVELSGSSAVHVAHGVIGSRPGAVQAQRLSDIYDGIEEVLSRYRPDAVSLERVFLSRNVQSALKLGQARGVALLAAARRHATVYEYTAAEIKMAVAGYGQATKEQVHYMVSSLLKLRERMAPDASDALAAAVCHVHRHAYEARVLAAVASAAPERSRNSPV